MPMILDSPPPEPDLREARRREHHEADVVVVGAGVLGCAMAVTFARQGRSVILLEKSLKQPDRIVGELLQPGGVAALEALGLRDCLEDIDAIRVQGYELFFYDRAVNILYPSVPSFTGKTFSPDGSRPEGRSFHHGRFIARLRAAAMREPNITVIETTATSLIKTDDPTNPSVLGVQCKTAGNPDYYFAALTVVCDGYASTFRKGIHPHTPASKSKFYGLELHDCALPKPLHGHVILGDGAPTLLYQIGTHDTRILVDVPADLPSASVAAGGVKGHLRKVVLPTLPLSVQPSFADALDRADRGEPGAAIRSMPNSWLPPSTAANARPGLLLLGDALNMRHPLTGGGMTVALTDVAILQDLLGPGAVPDVGDAAAVARAMRAFHWRRKGTGTTVINILAQALYSLFAADDTQLKALQMGCFRYFTYGGACIAEPAGLLAGIITRPFVLVYHFFSVALLAMWIWVVEGPASVPSGNASRLASDEEIDKARVRVFSPNNLVAIPMRAMASAAVFYKACAVILPYIFSEMKV